MPSLSFLHTAFLVSVSILLTTPPKTVDASRTGAFLSSVPSTQMPLLPESGRDLVTMKLPPFYRENRGFDVGREVKGCMPKGPGHSSAPSRYVNYQPLGSAVTSRCSPSPLVLTKP
ncbi:hypothetical protein SAY86_017169 [Trapa natans]|uniref:Secreted protein n=1 Tax=Trapa natans TaxID=22666 RepID=A0AAN7M5T4_TRANT|nr:hypothetical protein SAY86_017169 [Trapa natans]